MCVSIYAIRVICVDFCLLQFCKVIPDMENLQCYQICTLDACVTTNYHSRTHKDATCGVTLSNRWYLIRVFLMPLQYDYIATCNHWWTFSDRDLIRVYVYNIPVLIFFLTEIRHTVTCIHTRRGFDGCTSNNNYTVLLLIEVLNWLYMSEAINL